MAKRFGNQIEQWTRFMIKSRLLEIPEWCCHWARGSSASFQDRNVPIFRKYFTARTLLEIRIGATLRRTLVELAKCEGIPLVFRIESLIFDDSEFWVEPIALDRFRKVHGFASSLLFPSLFRSPFLLFWNWNRWKWIL